MSHISQEMLEDASACMKGMKEEGVDDKGNLKALKKDDKEGLVTVTASEEE